MFFSIYLYWIVDSDAETRNKGRGAGLTWHTDSQAEASSGLRSYVAFTATILLPGGCVMLLKY